MTSVQPCFCGGGDNSLISMNKGRTEPSGKDGSPTYAHVANTIQWSGECFMFGTCVRDGFRLVSFDRGIGRNVAKMKRCCIVSPGLGNSLPERALTRERVSEERTESAEGGADG